VPATFPGVLLLGFACPSRERLLVRTDPISNKSLESEESG
jgi:hypothetical protein